MVVAIWDWLEDALAWLLAFVVAQPVLALGAVALILATRYVGSRVGVAFFIGRGSR
jgi:hypothetical protein